MHGTSRRVDRREGGVSLDILGAWLLRVSGRKERWCVTGYTGCLALQDEWIWHARLMYSTVRV